MARREIPFTKDSFQSKFDVCCRRTKSEPRSVVSSYCVSENVSYISWTVTKFNKKHNETLFMLHVTLNWKPVWLQQSTRDVIARYLL